MLDHARAQQNCLPKSVFDVTANRLVRNVSYTDVPHPESHEEEPLIDCCTAEVSALRYPWQGYSPDEYLKKEDVKKVLDDCKKLVQIIKETII